jgi:uncharacterized protein YjeT (DUF2065 family)
MTHRSLFGAGIVALAAGLFLYWALPIWFRFLDIYEWSSFVLQGIVFCFVVTLSATGAVLILRGIIEFFFPREESENQSPF